LVGLLTALTLLATACTSASPAAQPGAPSSNQAAIQNAPSKKITAVTATVQLDMLPNNPNSGVDEFRLLVNPGLSVVNDHGDRQAVLAQDVPTLQNGLWQVFPDGRMETTWKLRPDLHWHDGTPFTSADLVFTASLGKDKELSAFGDGAYDAISEVVAPDPSTVTVRWNRPYVEADAMFSTRLALPLPAHILQEPARTDKANLLNLPYWTTGYVGTGPYRVKEWVPDNYVILQANDQYTLGRPKITDIELKLIPDPNTVMANVLAGSIDVSLGSSAVSTIERAIQLRDNWQGGRVSIEFGQNTWVVIWPQFLDPNPPVIRDLRFRQALLSAIDRQEMVDSLQSGLVPVANSFLSPNQPQYQEIESHVPRYTYDPRRSVQLLDEIGLSRRPDGFYYDASGQRVEVEVRNATVEIVQKSAQAVADYWQKVGVASTLVSIPPQRVTEYEYLSTFPSFRLMTLRNDIKALPDYHSSRTRTPANNFQVPGNGNWARYSNPEFDALIDRYFATIPIPERIQVLGQIASQMADQLVGLPMFYGAAPEVISNRMVNVSSGRPTGSLISWNAVAWDLKPN
jgi:peptide/nickel transport system substrate-binding protein